MTSGNRGPLLAGAAKVDITPQDLTGLTNLWGRPFEGVHDRIYVRALVLDNGINSAAIVAADLVEFGDTIELRQRIEQEVGIPAEHIIITASHDHNPPGLVPPPQGQRHKKEVLRPENIPGSHMNVSSMWSGMRRKRGSRPKLASAGEWPMSIRTEMCSRLRAGSWAPIHTALRRRPFGWLSLKHCLVNRSRS